VFPPSLFFYGDFMAKIEHANISDPYIHEPKGIQFASANQVYVADGEGGGYWTDVDLNPVAQSMFFTFDTSVANYSGNRLFPTNFSEKSQYNTGDSFCIASGGFITVSVSGIYKITLPSFTIGARAGKTGLATHPYTFSMGFTKTSTVFSRAHYYLLADASINNSSSSSDYSYTSPNRGPCTLQLLAGEGLGFWTFNSMSDGAAGRIYGNILIQRLSGV
jgi:hypothetical protein